jgi:exodeoxyribonuclease (lambda-induced)
MLTFDSSPQGSAEWLAVRKGKNTGSMFRVARTKLKSGAPDKKALDYAMDVARERCGGTAPGVYETAAMRHGKEMEPVAREKYELLRGVLVDEVGFGYTEDGLFGCSVDGFIDDDGVLEVKTMVSSSVMFTAMVDGDISAYDDQCMGALWLTGRKWTDLVLYCSDLDILKIVRIERNDDRIEALEADLMAHERRVQGYVKQLQALMRAAAPAAPPAVTAVQPAAKPARELALDPFA